jgi:hypothetical protein
MKNYTMGIFNNVAPDIEDEDEHIVVPYYNEEFCHWSFIIVEIDR